MKFEHKEPERVPDMELSMERDKENLSYVEELKIQLNSFVEAFATVVDERTPYNGNHTRKVAEYAEMLADYIEKMYQQGKCEEGFDEERKEKLMLVALLHDIGKMVIPLRVMNRATRLEEEMDQIEQRFAFLASRYEVDMLRNRISGECYQEKVKELQEALDFIKKINGMGVLDEESCAYVKGLAEKKYQNADGTQFPT